MLLVALVTVVALIVLALEGSDIVHHGDVLFVKENLEFAVIRFPGAL